jgi:protease I
MAKVAILLEAKYEDLELQYPRLRLKEAGHEVDVVGPKAGEQYVGKWGYPQTAEKAARSVQARDYNLIIIPGGMSPDFMRRDEGMIRLVREASSAKIPMAAICHGPWMLCSTDALKDRRCTSFFAIAHDVVNAGGKWVDEECVVDGPIITSRCPDDLPAFMKAVLLTVSGESAKGTKGKTIAPGWMGETIPS